MDRHEKLAILNALEMFIEENGDVWYSYAENEVGTPVFLKELFDKITKL